MQARPWFRPSTWVSSVAGIGFVSCPLCKLMYFARMTKHSVWHRLSVVYLYPLCGSKILYSYWLSKRSQLSNVVFDPFPFEACVCSSLFCVFEIETLYVCLNEELTVILFATYTAFFYFCINCSVVALNMVRIVLLLLCDVY